LTARVPNPVPGVDVLSLPLSTKEGFVLSRVDGNASLADISIMVGIGQDDLMPILERLSDLGAVELPWKPNAGSNGRGARKAAPAAESPAAPSAPPDRHFAEAAPRYDPRELDEDSALSPELRKRVLDAFYAIEGRNHYQLLGVDYDADRKVIRARYFELSKVFHPDSMFGKDLGNFRQKMELVFKRLTEAYEVLGRKKRRTEYDEYLRSQGVTFEARKTFEAAERAAEQIRRSAHPSAPDEPPAGEPATPSRAAMPPPSAPAAEEAARQSLRPPVSTAERRARVRQRLRQRLKSVSTRPPPPASEDTSQEDLAGSAGGRGDSPGPAPRRSAVDDLRHSLRASAAVTGSASVEGQVKQHMARAVQAEENGEPMTAASELQLALALDPENDWLLKEYERVSRQVARVLADNYEKQARYEEKTGNWAAAATSWARVSDGRPEQDGPARLAAEAMVKAAVDLHRAEKYARRALEVDADSPANLKTLARVYLAAGLKKNAKRELEKAAKLAPDDEMVKNLMREAR
jgi:curved DNA-binding protein CbpA